jgi:hypothetical protein
MKYTLRFPDNSFVRTFDLQKENGKSYLQSAMDKYSKEVCTITKPVFRGLVYVSKEGSFSEPYECFFIGGDVITVKKITNKKELKPQVKTSKILEDESFNPQNHVWTLGELIAEVSLVTHDRAYFNFPEVEGLKFEMSIARLESFHNRGMHDLSNGLLTCEVI